MAQKSREEIELLKENWKKDPCWDIYDTEGFEDHFEELSSFQKDFQIQKRVEMDKKECARLKIVSEQTGVIDPEIVSCLYTWSQIEEEVEHQTRYISKIDNLKDQVTVELMQASIRAALLQAAQLKRIADVLENIDDSNSLQNSARIWGSGE